MYSDVHRLDQQHHYGNHPEMDEGARQQHLEPGESRRERQANEAREQERSFVQFFNSRCSWSDGLIDCLTIVRQLAFLAAAAGWNEIISYMPRHTTRVLSL
jgi:hypothetical protein